MLEGGDGRRQPEGAHAESLGMAGEAAADKQRPGIAEVHHLIVKTTDDHGDWVGIDHHGKHAFVYAQCVYPLPKEPETGGGTEKVSS